jgi:replicative DNA helicase
MPQTLSKFSQDNILTILSYDDDNCQLVRNAITPELFDYPYNKIVEKCISYIDKYKRPPKDHIADELEKELQKEDAERYREAIQSINYLKENLDARYVIEKLTEFIRNQRFNNALYDAVALNQQGKTLEAMELISNANDINLSIFDPGIKVTDLDLLVRSLDEDDFLPSGIRALDELKIGLAKRQLLVFLASKSKGKSFFCVQAGKMAMWMNKKVVHISLEIDKEIVLQRYVQNILAITRWQAEMIKSPLFVRDSNNSIIRVDQAILHPRNLDEPEIIEYIRAGFAKIGPRLENNIRIKDFPSGQLTMSELRAYLDGLERTENYKPDLLILDMPMNMSIPVKDYRIAIGRLIINIRGLAKERNMAIMAPHQVNRDGDKAKFITGQHVSEDWSIMGTADTGIIFNQKPTEFKYGLSRLWVDRGRSQQSQLTILNAMNLKIAQPSLDSALLPESYSVEEALSSAGQDIQDEGENND